MEIWERKRNKLFETKGSEEGEYYYLSLYVYTSPLIIDQKTQVL